MSDKVDIKENRLLELDGSGELLGILLTDMTKSSDAEGSLKPAKNHQNIIWATSGYKGHRQTDQINTSHITGVNGNVIQPRVEKDKQKQKERTKSHAEVFTPAWVVQKQVDMVIDGFGKCEHGKFFDKPLKSLWAEQSGPTEQYSAESAKKLTGTRHQVCTENKCFDEYLNKTWLEITCGEAPYICNRYDAVSGKPVLPLKRVGFLDRKLQRVNAMSKQTVEGQQENWLNLAKTALKSCYGFDFQGDNVVLARENVLETVRDFYYLQFSKPLDDLVILRELAIIIAWNIFQMDGLKFVVPFSCRDEVFTAKRHIPFDPRNPLAPTYEEYETKYPCQGCAKSEPDRHTGVYVKVMEWNSPIPHCKKYCGIMRT